MLSKFQDCGGIMAYKKLKGALSLSVLVTRCTALPDSMHIRGYLITFKLLLIVTEEKNYWTLQLFFPVQNMLYLFVTILLKKIRGFKKSIKGLFYLCI